MVTLDDIALTAGVNKTTVSKALRGTSDISKETARTIRAIAVSMGYIVKQKTPRELSKYIGIICPEVKSAYYAEIVTRLSQLFSERGYVPLFSLTHFDGAMEVSMIENFVNQNVAGIICLTESDYAATKLREVTMDGQVPVLQIAMNLNAKEYDNICIDEAMAIEYAIKHLIDMGHRKIAFLGDQYANYRLKYFRQYTEKYGIAVENDYIILNEKRHFECGYIGAGDLLKLKDRPSAIIAEYDDVALGAIRRFQESGLKVPEDISVIGSDNADYTPYLYRALTTIDGHVDEMCSIAAKIMDRKITNLEYSVVQNISIKPELLIRETTFRNKPNMSK